MAASFLIAACARAQAAAPPIVVTATPPATAAGSAGGLAPISFTGGEDVPQGPSATPYPTTDFQSESGLPTHTAPPPPTFDALSFDFGTVTPYPTLSWRPPPLPVPVSIRPEDHFWFQRPIASNAVNWPHPFYRYGSTYFGFMNVHTGVDIDSPLYTPVLAAGDGVVVQTGMGLLGVRPVEDDPYGIAVVIKHSFGYNNQDVYTLYAHMSEVNVWPDQPVKAGDQIGKIGLTGFTSGPHLHFEVRIADNKFRTTYNPELWLAPPTGWGVLVGRALDRNGNYIPELPIEVYDSSGRYYPIVTYSTSTRTVNMDPLYQENFVLSDLPAGTYSYALNINGERYIGVADILAGQSTFVVVQEGMDRRNIPRSADPQATHGRLPTPTGTLTPSKTPTPRLLPTATGVQPDAPTASP